MKLSTPVHGVRLEDRKVFLDSRGAVLHVLRADAPGFAGFGEIYASEINPGVMKGWKRHSRATQQLVAPRGRVRFAFHDDRLGSPTAGARASCELGRPDAYGMLFIPPMVWYGWKCLGTEPALLINCASLPHDPEESEQRDVLDAMTTYDW